MRKENLVLANLMKICMFFILAFSIPITPQSFAQGDFKAIGDTSVQKKIIELQLKIHKKIKPHQERVDSTLSDFNLLAAEDYNAYLKNYYFFELIENSLKISLFDRKGDALFYEEFKKLSDNYFFSENYLKSQSLAHELNLPFIFEKKYKYISTLKALANLILNESDFANYNHLSRYIRQTNDALIKDSNELLVIINEIIQSQKSAVLNSVRELGQESDSDLASQIFENLITPLREGLPSGSKTLLERYLSKVPAIGDTMKRVPVNFLDNLELILKNTSVLETESLRPLEELLDEISAHMEIKCDHEGRCEVIKEDLLVLILKHKNLFRRNGFAIHSLNDSHLSLIPVIELVSEVRNLWNDEDGFKKEVNELKKLIQKKYRDEALAIQRDNSFLVTKQEKGIALNLQMIKTQAALAFAIDLQSTPFMGISILIDRLKDVSEYRSIIKIDEESSNRYIERKRSEILRQLNDYKNKIKSGQNQQAKSRTFILRAQSSKEQILGATDRIIENLPLSDDHSFAQELNPSVVDRKIRIKTKGIADISKRSVSKRVKPGEIATVPDQNYENQETNDLLDSPILPPWTTTQNASNNLEKPLKTFYLSSNKHMRTHQMMWDSKLNHMSLRFKQLENLVKSVQNNGENGEVQFISGSHCWINLPFPNGRAQGFKPHRPGGESKVPSVCVDFFRQAFENAGFTRDSAILAREVSEDLSETDNSDLFSTLFKF
jgi:hypothetical protein